MAVQTLPEAGQRVIDQYRALEIGNKKITTPYYINEFYDEEYKRTHQYPPDIARFHKRRKIQRVFIGKGRPEELEQAVGNLARSHKFDLEKASKEEMKEFMMRHELGIDCSGFVVWILNEIVKKTHNKPLWKLLHFKGSILRKLLIFLRPVENISVVTLQNNAVEVALLHIQPADIIISWYGDHVLLVTKVSYAEKGVPRSFEYSNSTCWYGKENGIRGGKVEIIKPDGKLQEQKWLADYDEQKKNWTFEGIKKNGKLMRLKAI